MFISADVEPVKRGPGDDFWFYPVGFPSNAGVRVSPRTALAVSTLYACCLVLGQTLATVPLHLYKRLDRGKERAVKHPLYRLLHAKPNRWQTSYQWRQMMQWHQVLRYNAYSRILSDPRTGMPTELIPLHPDRVVVERFMGADSVQNFRYRYTPGDGRDPLVLLRHEVLHIRGLTSDGIEGFSPLDAQRESIGEAITAQNYNSRRLANDAKPGGVLEWEGHFATDDDRKKFRASWQEAQSGSNQGKTAVLERGMTWKDLGVKNSELQFIELRKLKREDIAAAWRMQPHKVGIMDKATFSNIEHLGIEFLTDTMLPQFTNWEQELSVQLLTEEEQDDHFFGFLADGLLRGDSKARGEFYNRRFQTGSISPNDIRELENENPVIGGDRYFVPVNMVPVDRVDDVVDRGGNKSSGPGQDDGTREEQLETAAAERVLRKEVAAMQRLDGLDDETMQAEGLSFYQEHQTFVSEVMAVDGTVAAEYCAHRIEQLRNADTCEDFVSGLVADDLIRIARGARQ